MDLEAFVPWHTLLDALSNCLLLRAAGCHAPPFLRAFWELKRPTIRDFVDFCMHPCCGELDN